MPKQSEYSAIPAWRRTDYCGALRGADDGREVALWGWVASRRDHGGLIFIDLRDREGIIQLVFNPAHDADAHVVADTARAEYYLAVKGKVVRRSESTVNAELPTGEIEVAVTEGAILNASLVPPFPLGAEAESAGEELRLRYRYLALRWAGGWWRGSTRTSCGTGSHRRFRALSMRTRWSASVRTNPICASGWR